MSNIKDAIQALRDAGGDGWDNIADPEELLGRKPAEPTFPPLEIPCPDCGGSGRGRFEELVYDCARCEAKGTITTEFGKEVLRFVRKNLKIEVS